MRIGIFGGSFDPIHLGHLILAEQCREQGQLEQVVFIPAARPPHKQTQGLTAFDRRVEMLTLAIAGQPAFRCDEMEKERPGPSYTADTLRTWKEKQPAAELYLILGADMAADLPYWYQPVRVIELATLLVAQRPGWEMPSFQQIETQLGQPAPASVRWQPVRAPLIEIASRDIRRRAAEGRSIRYLVPRAVEAYIQEKHLYTEM